MTDIQIPAAAMVEAGARALAEHRSQLRGDPADAWDEPPVPPSMHESWRDTLRQEATAVIAGALGVCEVEEQEGLRLDWTDQHGGLDESWEAKGSGWARNAERLHNGARLVNPDYPARASVIKRLVITTPAEQVDTEGAK